MELLFQWTGEFTKSNAKPGNSHGRNPLVPRVLIVGCDGENLFQQHLRRKVRPDSRKLSATVAAKQARAHDGSGQGRTRNSSEQNGPIAIKQRNGRERRTQDDSGLQSSSFGQGFVFTNNALPGKAN